MTTFMERLLKCIYPVILLCVLFSVVSCGGGGRGDTSGTNPPPPGQLALALDLTALPAGVVDTPCNQSITMTASGGVPPYSYNCSVSGGAGMAASVIPAGPTAGNAVCTIGGTPATSGPYTVSFGITDSLQSTVSASPLSFNVNPLPGQLALALDPTALPAGVVNTPYNQNITVTASGGAPPYSFNCSVSGGAGMAASVNPASPTTGNAVCTLNGTPTTSGPYTVSFSATDSLQSAASASPLSFSVNPLPPPSSGLDTWHPRTSRTTAQLDEVTYGNGTFVAVGDGGTILSSPDGLNWTSRNSGTSTTLSGATYGNGTFVAVGDADTTLTSPDGVSWGASGSSTGGDQFSHFRAVTYGNGIFVAVATKQLIGDYSFVLTSVDGVKWTSVAGPFSSQPEVDGPFFAILLQDVTFGSGTFLAVGDNFVTSSFFVTSPDAINWILRDSGTNAHLRGVAYGNGIFVAVGIGGAILTSPDGLNWTSRNSGTSNPLGDVAFGNGAFVVVGSGGTILTSADGVAWTPRTSGTTVPLVGVTSGNGTFVVVGSGGIILQSDPVSN